MCQFRICSNDTWCDDGQFCNGIERCSVGARLADARGCLPPTGNPCETSSCAPPRTRPVWGPVASGACPVCVEDVNRCVLAVCLRGGDDADGDGVESMLCGGNDCDDGNATRYPGASETCNNEDEDCNDATLGDLDADNDGVISSACCNGAESGRCGADCDDSNPLVQPGATDDCNGIDDDCDGIVDNGGGTTFYRDRDGDGHGDATEPTNACTIPVGYATLNNDCDDANAAKNPGAPEICDGLDNDCDGTVDEGVLTTYHRDTDGDGYGDAPVFMVGCSRPPGYADRAGDCDDARAQISPAAREVCDAGRADENCDGAFNEGCACADGSGQACGLAPIGACAARGTQTCVSGVWGPCVGAGLNTVELCNGIDDDCDTIIDDGVQIRIYTDSDGDGFGSGLSMLACTATPGWSTRAGDCNDANFLIYPGAGYCVGPTSYAICSITGTAPVSIPCPVATPTCEALSGGYVRCR